MENNTGTSRKINHMIYMYYVAFAVHVVLRSAMLPIFKESFGFTYTQTSFIVIASTVGFLVSAASSAWLGSILGKHRMLSFYMLVLFVLSFIIIFIDSPWTVIGIYFLFGFGYGGLDSTLISVIRDCNPVNTEQALNRSLGFYCIGSVICALFTGYVIEKGMSWKVPFVGAFLVCLVAFVWSIKTPEALSEGGKSNIERGDFIKLLKTPLFIYMCFVTAFYAGIENTSNNWMTTFVSQSDIGTGFFIANCITAVYYFANLCGRKVFAYLYKVFDEVFVEVGACILAAITLFASSFVKDVMIMLVCIALFGMLIAGIYPVLMSITGKVGASSAIYSIAFVQISFFNFTLNYIVGFFADLTGMSGVFRLNSLFIVMVAALSLVGRSRLKKAGYEI